MAASLKDVKTTHKRRLLELEYQNKKLKVLFETPPSPGYPGELYVRNRAELYDNHYENSPLLTPKDEEDNLVEENNVEAEDVNSSVHANEVRATDAFDCQPDNVLSQTITDLLDEPHVLPSLESNPDYLSLTSSHRILTSSEKSLKHDINRLSEMQGSLTLKSKDECVAFFMLLVANELDLPSPGKVLKAPVIDWSRYHSSLGNVARDFKNVDRGAEGMYKLVRVFRR